MSVEVVVCTYNNALALRRALASIVSQRDVPNSSWSILVVDNNSADATPSVAREAAARAAVELRYVREAEQGLAFARRRAFRESTRDWLAFVDDDCELPPDWLAHAQAFIDERDSAGAIGGRVKVVFPSGTPDVAYRREASYAAQDYGDQPRRLTEPLPRLVGAGLLLRKQAILRSGWIDGFKLQGRTGTKLGSGEDTELVIAARRAGFEIWYTPRLALEHHIAPQRATLAYLCRLNLGFGESGPYLQALAGEIALDSFSRRVAFLLRQIAGMGWFAARWAAAAVRSSKYEPDRRVELFAMTGRLKTALRIVAGNATE